MAYATSSDYLTWTNTTVAPAGIGRILEVASTRVDEMLTGVLYATDANGAPTDVDMAALMKSMTCEQAFYMLELGDTSGAGSFTELTVGRISYQQGSGKTAIQPSKFSPVAQGMLQTAGLIPVYVVR